jgi:sialate O-acetylesterase
MKLNTSTKYYFLLLSLLFLATLNCSLLQKQATNIQLSVLFSDNMVLQRDAKIPVWGTADPGGTVVVEIAGQRRRTTVSQGGDWRLNLRALAVGGPFEMLIIGQDTTAIKNVLVGEVWICSGQSNMEMALRGQGIIKNYREEISNADYPNIRLFQVIHTTSTVPLDSINCPGWDVCSPATIPEFSSVAYFFGRKVFKELGVPVGLIHTSWGGTPAEAWTSAGALKEIPDFRKVVESMESAASTRKQTLEGYQHQLKLRNEKIQSMDAGFENGKAVWNKSHVDAADWKTMDLPTKWENAGYPSLDGIMWFRKEINLPGSMVGTDLTLHLGPINDIDITWFNGQKVGGVSGADIPRKYSIPKSLVRSGKNVIVVRVEDIAYTGGLWGTAEQMFIENAKGGKISLAGTWLNKIGFDSKVLGPRPHSPKDPNRPTVLFNAMIHPLLPFAIQGAIWYQGEANAGRAFQYQTLFPTMISDWRNQWQQGDFPFLFVQLANFMEQKNQPQDDDWAELREAQLKTLSLPNTGMAVAIDIGDALDIHPKNKQEVGRRLALNALKLVYEQDIAHCGPIYKSKTIEGNKIRLTFDHAYDGLMTTAGEELHGFAIAGTDSVFHWAQAEISGDKVVVWNDDISNPQSVRYAWAANPVCNLYNKAGLPASPFRTDSWPGITEGRK